MALALLSNMQLDMAEHLARASTVTASVKDELISELTGHALGKNGAFLECPLVDHTANYIK